MLILNDIHLGVRRSAGTTAQTSYDLRRWLQERYAEMLSLPSVNEVAINGDFFDTHTVPLEDVLESFLTTAGWLQGDSDRKIHLIPGNHDLSKNSNEVGSFQLMAQLLEAQFPKQVNFVMGSGWVKRSLGIYAISHVVNQAHFDAHIATVPDEAKYLLLHCNYDSPFAEQSDHSLNLSREQAKLLTQRGVTIIVAHEHHPREAFGGKLVVTGNQWPSSISDCITPEGKTHDKRAAWISPEGLEFTDTWLSSRDERCFRQVDWKEVDSFDAAGAGFIRVTGAAEPEQSSEALRAVSALRQRCNAFVVTNSVKVSQRDDASALASSVEDVRQVDIVEMLIETLTDEQQAVVRRVIKEGS